ncbi:hypothetical protein AcV5_002471 [Taiwanofungus camphoratus]|nr:hypothetical protein AcV5_002471 [Antrodia cinnamomea]
MSTAVTISRTDGRRPDQLRKLTVVYEGLDRVDGSARFGFGQTQSLTSVSGPIEVRPNLEIPSQATLDVQIRPLASISGTDSKALALVLKAILTPALLLSQHPRTLVQIVGQALCGSDSGHGTGSVGKGWNASLIASLVNASSAALINASSVPMRGVVCAVSIGRLPSTSGTTLVLDPTEMELSRLTGGGCFAFLFSSVLSSSPKDTADIPPCSLLWTNYTANTPFDESELSSAHGLAEQGAREVWKTLKDSVSWMEKSSTTESEWKTRTKDKEELLSSTNEETSEQELDDEKMEI